MLAFPGNRGSCSSRFASRVKGTRKFASKHVLDPGTGGMERCNLLHDRRAFSSIPSWLCQSLLLFMSRRSILRPLPFRLAYPVTHKSELLSVSKGMQGEMKGRERENGIVFCAVRSILRHGDAPARRTCVCARIIGNGGVLDSPRSKM